MELLAGLSFLLVIGMRSQVPPYMGLSIGLLECLHDMAASFPQSNK